MLIPVKGIDRAKQHNWHHKSKDLFGAISAINCYNILPCSDSYYDYMADSSYK
jgi:hypothetical protein